jgi:nucleoside-diphosphate-sugar epimerase
VTGATGFVGRNLCRLLTERRMPYVALARETSNVAPLTAIGATVRRADLCDVPALTRALEGCAAVVHLAAAADVTDPALNARVNVAGVEALIAACRPGGVRRVLFFSSNCATRRLRDAYGVTKFEGEQRFAASGLDVTVFRPTMIYGADSKEFGTFVRTVRRCPLVPIIGSGRHTIRPVALPDVLEAALAALARPATIGRTYDIAGPESISFNDLVHLVARLIGRRRRIMHVPVGLARVGARCLGALMKHPPVTVDQVLAFAQDTQADIEPARRDLDFRPRPLEPGLSDLFSVR